MAAVKVYSGTSSLRYILPKITSDQCIIVNSSSEASDSCYEEYPPITTNVIAELGTSGSSCDNPNLVIAESYSLSQRQRPVGIVTNKACRRKRHATKITKVPLKRGPIPKLPIPKFVPTRTGEVLTKQSKQIVLNVFAKLAKMNPMMNVTDLSRKVADMTGVSVSTIYKMRRERYEKGKIKLLEKAKDMVGCLLQETTNRIGCHEPS